MSGQATRRVRIAGVAVAAVGLVLAAAGPAGSWGFTAHRLVTRKAIATLPPPLRELFAANADYLSEHSIDPDLWRAAGRAGETVNHFLDLDAFGAFPFAQVEHEEARHYERFGNEARQYGRLPWRVAEAHRDLVSAFREGDEARILAAAAVLAHYVGDAHVPLHAALNHDGQLTGQTGLHARWERWLVDRYERQIEAGVEPGPARRVDDPVRATLEALAASWTAAQAVLASDLASVGDARDLAQTPEDDRYGDAYYSRLFEREAERLTGRAKAAADLLGSFWLSAYEQAGRPALDVGFRFARVRKQERLLLLSFGGVSAAAIDEATTRGRMPQLAQIRREGMWATLTGLPGSRAAAAATLFTGHSRGVDGTAPDPLASTDLLAEPLWVTATREGLEVTTLAVPQTFPYGPFEQERRFGGNFGRNLTLLHFQADPGGVPIFFYNGGALAGNKVAVAEDASKVLKARELAASGAQASGPDWRPGRAFADLLDWALLRTRADLLVAYLPFDDPRALATPEGAIRAIEEAIGAVRKRDGDAVLAVITLPPRSVETSGGTFAVSGRGTGAGQALGQALGTMRPVDMAPTLLALAGLGPPAQAEGEVVAAALRSR